MNVLERVRRRLGEVGRPDDEIDREGCECVPRFENVVGTGIDDRVELVLDGDDCPGNGDLVENPACRATAVAALADRDADAVRTRSDGWERYYAGDAASVLLAAGRFVERVAVHDDRLAALALAEPFRAARQATGRVGPVATVAAETGLAEGAARWDAYGDVLAPAEGPVLANARIDPRPPPDAELVARADLDTGAVARVYEESDGRRTYHLEPVEHRLDPPATAVLATARDLLASGGVTDVRRTASRAVRRVADETVPVETVSAVLAKHTSGVGVFEDLFADPSVTDAFLTAPAGATTVRVTRAGERLSTNVSLTPRDAAAFASRLRRASGRAFSRSTPVVDAVVAAGRSGGPTGETDRLRVAGVTRPASDGLGFAFRRHDATAWTLPGLVENDTVPPGAAALLSLAVQRGASLLLAGTRGAGKTTALGALLWELPTPTRVVTIEDTPELPVEALQREGRDVQALFTGSEADPEPSPTAALRAALRLGEGALVVGEVRGEEAAVLYEAMRVGANGSAVLGTIHGDGAESVRERVVSDLGVPASSFAATDLLVTLANDSTRQVARVEEVHATDDGVGFAALYQRSGDGLRETGTVARGNSRLVASLTRPGESYADVLDRLTTRTDALESLADAGQTRPADVVAAYQAGRKS